MVGFRYGAVRGSLTLSSSFFLVIIIIINFIMLNACGVDNVVSTAGALVVVVV